MTRNLHVTDIAIWTENDISITKKGEVKATLSWLESYRKRLLNSEYEPIDTDPEDELQDKIIEERFNPQIWMEEDRLKLNIHPFILLFLSNEGEKEKEIEEADNTPNYMARNKFNRCQLQLSCFSVKRKDSGENVLNIPAMSLSFCPEEEFVNFLEDQRRKAKYFDEFSFRTKDIFLSNNYTESCRTHPIHLVTIEKNSNHNPNGMLIL